jgi:DNA-binding transcriptional LysR family regulator
MTVELRHLRYFLAVAEELHFGRAAERVQIAQPALSQQIRKLETEIGVELFHRTKRQVELSAGGEAMVRPARQALDDAANAVEAAQRAARGETGHLTIGFIETAASTIVPLAVRRFSADHPDVGLSLRELSVDAQVDGLRSGALDVGIVRPPIDAPELQLTAVADEGLVVAAPEGHRLAQRKRVAPASLAGEPLVLLAREVVPGLYDQVIGLQREHDGAFIAQEATSIQAVLGLVAAGLGISLLPASVRSLDRSGVSFTALSPSPRSSMLLASRKTSRSPLTAAFLAAAIAAGRAPGPTQRAANAPG